MARQRHSGSTPTRGQLYGPNSAEARLIDEYHGWRGRFVLVLVGIISAGTWIALIDPNPPRENLIGLVVANGLLLVGWLAVVVYVRKRRQCLGLDAEVWKVQVPMVYLAAAVVFYFGFGG